MIKRFSAWTFGGLVASCLASGVAMSGDESDLSAWIELESADGQLVVLPMARSSRAIDVHYDLVVNAEGSTGQNRTRQSGVVSLGEEQPRELSSVRLSIANDTHYRIKLVARDSNGVTVNANKEYSTQ